MRVTLRPAVGLIDALRMRRVRNTCREFMTRNQSHIGIFGQLQWWLTRDPHLHPHLLWVSDTVVGYGIILEDGDLGLLTGGLLPGFRGMGFGEDLFQMLIENAQERRLLPALEVLEANPRARRLYTKLGFETTGSAVGDTGAFVTMELPP